MSGIRTHAAAELLGVSPNTLRSWERRFTYPRPRRTAGGHRQYDLAELEALRRALLETHNISSAIEVARRRGEGPSSANRLLDAFDRFDEVAADRVLEESLAVRSVERTVEDVLLPAVEAADDRTSREAELELACRWATGWLHAQRRIASPASRSEAVVIFDASERLDFEALQVQALELALRRGGLPDAAALLRPGAGARGSGHPRHQPERLRVLRRRRHARGGGPADVRGQAGGLVGAGARVPRVDAGQGRALGADPGQHAHRGRGADAQS